MVDYMKLVKHNGLALQLVDEQTPEICMAAVQNCPSAIRYVKNQTPEICMAAVKNSGYRI